MSTTYIAAIVAFLTTMAQMFGWTVDSGALVQTITDGAQVLSILYIFYGRYKAGGISAFGFRVAPPSA